MRRVRSLVAASMLLVSCLLGVRPASALPSTAPAVTWGVNGTVRSIVKVGLNIWIGGQFTELLDPSGLPAIAVDNLAVLNASTGTPAAGLNPQLVTGSGSIVMDLATDGVNVYVAGRFTTVDGQARTSLAAISASTGLPCPTVFQHTLSFFRSVAVGPTRVFAGGLKLLSWLPNGTRDPAFSPVVAAINPSLRAKKVAPAFRDIAIAGGDLLVAGSFDYLNGPPAKVVAKISASTGAVEPWTPGGLAPTSRGYGLSLVLDAAHNAVYVAAGGNDFTAAYRLDTGAQYWTEDTSGSAQAIQVYPSDHHLIVGGHFGWVALNRGQQCGNHTNPNRSCLHQPKLVALSSDLNPTTGGLPDLSWRPSICCQYNGVWALLVDGSAIHLGGVFTQVDGRTRNHYARLG